jgi:hypothetical protein
VAHVKWIICHHGTARPHVANGEEAVLILRVTENILNKRSRTADKGWSSSLRIRGGGGVENLHIA